MTNGWEPYLYSKPSDTASMSFDPKPFSRAGMGIPPVPSIRHDGPLLDFNRHPDSWGPTRYSMATASPMAANTKKKVAGLRWTQFSLRLLNLIGAIGILVETIFLRNISDTANWLIRLIPSFDILIAAYSIYHLSRASKLRTPTNTASYHWFALVLDICLTPLYVWIALATRYELNMPSDNNDRWTTFFTMPDAINELLTATWLACVVIAGLHALGGIFSICLGCIFCQISYLPPDMNPLEDNLTSRRKTKHRYKNSELTGSKHDSAISFGSFDGRASPVKQDEMSEKPMTFFNTRDAAATQIYSPHTPNTAAASRLDLAQNQQPRQQSGLSRMLSVAASSIYSSGSRRSVSPPDLPRKSSKRMSGLMSPRTGEHDGADGVFVVEEDPEGEAEFADYDGPLHGVPVAHDAFGSADTRDDSTRQPARPTTATASASPNINAASNEQQARGPRAGYAAVRQGSFVDIPLNSPRDEKAEPELSFSESVGRALSTRFADPRLELQPLHMNPPTPPPASMPGYNANAAYNWSSPAPRIATPDRVGTPNWPLPSSRSRPHTPLASAAGVGVGRPESARSSPRPQSQYQSQQQQQYQQPQPPQPPQHERLQPQPQPLSERSANNAKPAPAPPSETTSHAPEQGTPRGKTYGDLAAAVSHIRHASPSPSPKPSPRPNESPAKGPVASLRPPVRVQQATPPPPRSGTSTPGSSTPRSGKAEAESGVHTRDWLHASPSMAGRAKAQRRARRARLEAAYAHENEENENFSENASETGTSAYSASQYSDYTGPGSSGVGPLASSAATANYSDYSNVGAPNMDRRGRVVSASGVDSGATTQEEQDRFAPSGALGMGSRRVSGKVVEEGLGGYHEGHGAPLPTAARGANVGGWRRRVSGRGLR